MKKAVSASIILTGFTAMASQIVLMREFLTVFWGNELVIGFVLAAWLAWGAAGSWFSGRVADRIKSPKNIFSVCQLFLSVFLPLSLLAIRSIKPILGIAAGEIAPFSLSFISTVVILAPLCAISGFMFSLGCRMYSADRGVSASGIGSVYILEAVGSMAGGLLASFVMIRFLPSLYIAALLSLLNILAAVFLARRPVLLVLLLAAALAWPFKIWDNLNRWSLQRQWKGYQLLDSRNSIYSNLSVVKKDSQVSFFSNGLHLYTVPDRLTSEEAVHFALLEHPEPKNVLSVGGGAGGLVAEIIKHPVDTVDYTELDPMIVDLSRSYLSGQDLQALGDRRVSVYHLDGRRFIKNAQKRYDCVILHLADPYTAQLNRFYTVEFFREVKNILKPGGIFSFSVTSSENYISRELALFLGSIKRSLDEVYGDIKIIPGDTAHFIACPKAGMLTYDYSVFEKRIKERGIQADFVRDYYLETKLSMDRIEYVQNRLSQRRAFLINYDQRPACYYYNMILQAAHFSGSFVKRILLAATEKRIYVIFILCAVVFLFLRGRNIVLAAVMTTGFSEIVFQVVVLLSFQVIYGYVFYKLGLIFTSFMAGLALGGCWIIQMMPKLKNDLRAFMWTQLAIAVYPLILPLVWRWRGSDALFSFLPAIAGFIGGVQFPLANKLYPAAGLSYGMDLFGSCLGAVVTAIFLIPILGIAKTCFLTAGINFLILAGLNLGGRHGK